MKFFLAPVVFQAIVPPIQKFSPFSFPGMLITSSCCRLFLQNKYCVEIKNQEALNMQSISSSDLYHSIQGLVLSGLLFGLNWLNSSLILSVLLSQLCIVWV